MKRDISTRSNLKHCRTIRDSIGSSYTRGANVTGTCRTYTCPLRSLQVGSLCHTDCQLEVSARDTRWHSMLSSTLSFQSTLDSLLSFTRLLTLVFTVDIWLCSLVKLEWSYLIIWILESGRFTTAHRRCVSQWNCRCFRVIRVCRHSTCSTHFVFLIDARNLIVLACEPRLSVLYKLSSLWTLWQCDMR